MNGKTEVLGGGGGGGGNKKNSRMQRKNYDINLDEGSLLSKHRKTKQPMKNI